MDWNAVRAGLEQAVPFNTHLGLEFVDIGPDRGVVRLPDDEKLRNHVGTQHAGGLFAVAEAASGAAFVGAFIDRLGGLTPLAKGATIAYLRLARGPITATASLDEPEAIAQRLDAGERAEFPVAVTLTDEDGEVVAEVTVQWHVRPSAA